MKSRMTAILRLVILGALLHSHRSTPRTAQADTILTVNTINDFDDGVCNSAHCSLRRGNSSRQRYPRHSADPVCDSWSRAARYHALFCASRRSKQPACASMAPLRRATPASPWWCWSRGFTRSDPHDPLMAGVCGCACGTVHRRRQCACARVEPGGLRHGLQFACSGDHCCRRLGCPS